MGPTSKESPRDPPPHKKSYFLTEIEDFLLFGQIRVALRELNFAQKAFSFASQEFWPQSAKSNVTVYILCFARYVIV